MAARKLRHHKGQGQLEDELLKNARWSGLREQQRLQSLHDSASDNKLAEAECRSLVVGGYGELVDYTNWLEVYGQK